MDSDVHLLSLPSGAMTGNCGDIFVLFAAYKFYVNQRCNRAIKRADSLGLCE